jgi:tripartite-type tricarboxylate transporter receptor subunit TctC
MGVTRARECLDGCAAPSRHAGCLINIGVSGCDPASAEDWASHPEKVVVPYGPGGIAYTLVRLTTDRLAKSFGQPFIVENKGGAGSIIGTELAARSPFASRPQASARVPTQETLKQ